MNKKDDISFSDKHNMKWVVAITVWTFIMAVVLNIITESLLKNLDIFMAFIILIIVIIGIFFDIGIAVTTAKEMPFYIWLLIDERQNMLLN